MKQLLFLLLALALFSCNRQSDLEKKLIASKWVVLEGKTLEKEGDKWPSDYYTFHADGEFKSLYMYSDEESTRFGNDGSVINDPMLWSYDADKKILILNGHKCKVLAVESDTVFLVRDTTHLILYNIDKTYPKLKKGPGHSLGG
ncbi:MAG: hypothetical protein DI539_00180 [Flavobacterium psychrophilum]|nr:MAG: hypothetical protein DI539_00180 [Flavobacterium psychrophilum]